MKKVVLFTAAILSACITLQAQQMFQKYTGTDIGNPEVEGSHQFDRKSQQFLLSGAGSNIWFDKDEFYFVSQEVEGDFILSANVEFVGNGVDPHRKAGLMIRNGKDEDAVYMDGALHGDSLTALQYRMATGGETEEIISEVKMPGFVQVERSGNEYIFRYSYQGQPLEEAGRIKLEMEPAVHAGLYICSHNEDVVEKARFWNVRLEKPAPENVDGYREASPSRLEILDIEKGNREVVYETESHIEAPNWSRDGKFLVYNSEGKLYNFNLRKGKPKVIDTGFATSNNNDHGISFDGKRIAISHHTETSGQRQSIIYTVPIKGGTPRRVTEKGPSYWHGWSPDDKWHVYCAERGGNYDVYKIDDEGGEEIRLTTAEGLDDGPAYSPDGRFIYFNSERSGSMEIWRMKPDGSDQEQLTDDEFQNWFAHPSPDGKWLIFISYLPEVPAGSHPHNQRVMLRLMSAEGGEITTMAFLYGGQGTINVPSWSPDSKKVAFMSYTY